MIRTSFISALAGAFIVTNAAAQAAAPTMAPNPRCEDAAVHLNGSALPRVGSADWNDWVTLTGCGARGATIIAGAMQSDGIRTETELTRLDHLAGLLDGWFQPQLVNAYESVLRTPDASSAMRLRAMWLLGGLYAPYTDVAGPLQGYMSARCEQYDRVTALRDAPASVPSSAYDQAVDAINATASDRTAPEYVRSTANCWQGVIRNSLANGAARNDANATAPNPAQPYPVQQAPAPVVVETAPTVVVEEPVRVVYECDNRFIFYNNAGYDLAVRYGGYGTSGMLRVLGGARPLVWVGARFGPVRFWVGEREIIYPVAVYRPCGGYRVLAAAPIYPWYGWHVGLGVYFGRSYYGPRYGAPVIVNRPVIVNPPRHEEQPRYATPRGGVTRDDRDHDARGHNDPRENHQEQHHTYAVPHQTEEGPRYVAPRFVPAGSRPAPVQQATIAAPAPAPRSAPVKSEGGKGTRGAQNGGHDGGHDKGGKKGK